MPSWMSRRPTPIQLLQLDGPLCERLQLGLPALEPIVQDRPFDEPGDQVGDLLEAGDGVAAEVARVVG